MTTPYLQLQAALVDARVAIDPAQVHGTWIGMLCSQRNLPAARWVGVVLEDSAVDSVSQSAVEELAAAGETAREALLSSEMTFAPALPADDQPLKERLKALGEWCSGLLYGLAVGGLNDFDRLGAQAREFIEDATELTRLVARPEPESVDETRFMELVEYTKVGVLTLLDELGEGAAPPNESPGPGSPQLH